MPKTAKKPYKDFPLFLHATGQWAKKIRGHMHYFGVDPEEALEKYLCERDDLQAGRTPRLHPDGLTLRDLCNRFLSAKRLLIDSGELSHRTWRDYYDVCERLLDAFGKDRTVATFNGEDFERLRAQLAKIRGPVALGNEIQRVRCIFKWAFENDLIEKPVRFGSTFRRPSAKTIRKARHEAGTRMIEATDLRRVIDVASQQLRAMILLGINCGFGQSDVAGLPQKVLDLNHGWVDFPRPKTAIPRRCKLWPETIEAVKEAIANRPEPRDPADAGLVFITKYGKRWVRVRERDGGKPGVPIDAVSLEFNKLLVALELKRRGLGFYALRHVFRTVADAAKDGPACDLIMGHIDPSMGAKYRERIEDDRIEAVVQLVHRWLWPLTGEK